MEENNSVGGAKFGFGIKPNTPSENQKDSANSPVEEASKQVNTDTVIAERVEYKDDYKDDYNTKDYLDNRSVSIALVKNFSLYRKANDKVLPKKKDFIGSSVNASRVLSSNKEEVEAYFPNIIGLSPNHVDFTLRVKHYLNNIRVGVDEMNVTFNTSFIYNSKADYYRIKEQEDQIEADFLKVNPQDLAKLKSALKDKITRINTLEGTKHKYGRPVEVEEYLLYRHCLLYPDVAKHLSLINSDPSIRFYFKDDQKEADKLRKFRNQVNKAKANYVATLADNVLFDAIYTQYLVLNTQPVISGLAEDKIDREVKLDRFSSEEPVKFNDLFANKDAKLIGDIELLIAHNQLIRSTYNQNITTEEGFFIGANIREAVNWFKNPENSSTVNAYMSKLNNI